MIQHLNDLAREIWLWCIERDIWLSCFHIPGRINTTADFSRRKNNGMEWPLDNDVFCIIVDIYGQFDIDLFASSRNRKCRKYASFKVIVLNTGIFWLLRTCSASFDHLIGEKTRMYFAKSLSDSIMNSYSLLPNITILIMQSTSVALQRI